MGYIVVRYSNPGIGIPRVYFINAPGSVEEGQPTVYATKEGAEMEAAQLSASTKHYHEVVEQWDWNWR